MLRGRHHNRRFSIFESLAEELADDGAKRVGIVIEPNGMEGCVFHHQRNAILNSATCADQTLALRAPRIWDASESGQRRLRSGVGRDFFFASHGPFMPARRAAPLKDHLVALDGLLQFHRSGTVADRALCGDTQGNRSLGHGLRSVGVGTFRRTAPVCCAVVTDSPSVVTGTAIVLTFSDTCTDDVLIANETGLMATGAGSLIGH